MSDWIMGEPGSIGYERERFRREIEDVRATVEAWPRRLFWLKWWMRRKLRRMETQLDRMQRQMAEDQRRFLQEFAGRPLPKVRP